jgi:hypothetical protein
MKRLKNVDTEEVSLVHRGANGKEFIEKNGDAKMLQEMIAKLLKDSKLDKAKIDEVLKALNLSPEALAKSKLDKAKIDEVLKALNLSPEVLAAVEGAIRMLDSVKDQLPAEILTHVAALANIAMPEQKKTEGATPKDDELAKSLEKLPENVRAVIVKERQEQAARLAKMEADIAKTQDQELGRIALAKAEALKSLPGDKSVLAAIFKQASKLDASLAKSIEEVLAAADAVIKKSVAFSETGSGAGGTAGTTMDRVNKMADEMVSKSTSGLTHAGAITKIFADNPKFYEEYSAGK